MDFDNRLKQIRVDAGMTQKQLAERIGVAKSVISYYEQGERFPSYDVLIKIARTFHVTTDFLLGVEHARMLDASDLNDEQIAVLQKLIDVMS